MNIINRNELIDVLRVISAFLIVWYHSEMLLGKVISYAGLIVFIVISIYLGFKSYCIGYCFKSRFKKLIIPWLVWSLVYGFANLALFGSAYKNSNGYFLNMLVGTHIHLWYLPFIFISLILSRLIKQKVSEKITAYLSIVSYVIWVLTSFLWRDWSFEIGIPVSLYMHAIGGVFIGLYMACSKQLSKEINFIFIFIMYISTIISLSFSNVGESYLVGISAILIALNYQTKKSINKYILKLSGYSYGIYLIHPIWIYIVKMQVSGILLPIATYILSVINIYLLHKLFPKYIKYAM